MVEILSEHWLRLVLSVLVSAAFLAIANMIRRGRRVAVRLLRESDARDEARLADRLSELTVQAYAAKNEKNHHTEEERKNGVDGTRSSAVGGEGVGEEGQGEEIVAAAAAAKTAISSSTCWKDVKTI
jgi:hypothetical protein